MIDITDGAVDEYAAAQSAAEPPALIELARTVTATAEPMTTAIGNPPQLPDVDTCVVTRRVV